jgi:hypothetical protein
MLHGRLRVLLAGGWCRPAHGSGWHGPLLPIVNRFTLLVCRLFADRLPRTSDRQAARLEPVAARAQQLLTGINALQGSVRQTEPGPAGPALPALPALPGMPGMSRYRQQESAGEPRLTCKRIVACRKNRPHDGFSFRLRKSFLLNGTCRLIPACQGGQHGGLTGVADDRQQDKRAPKRAPPSTVNNPQGKTRRTGTDRDCSWLLIAFGGGGNGLERPSDRHAHTVSRSRSG